MKILALDSSGLVAGVAVTEDDNLLGEYTINYKKTHSQTLLPMLDEVAKMIELDLNTIDVIAVPTVDMGHAAALVGVSFDTNFSLHHRPFRLRSVRVRHQQRLQSVSS